MPRTRFRIFLCDVDVRSSTTKILGLSRPNNMRVVACKDVGDVLITAGNWRSADVTR